MRVRVRVRVRVRARRLEVRGSAYYGTIGTRVQVYLVTDRAYVVLCVAIMMANF